MIALFRRRTILCPTLFGTLYFGGLLSLPLIYWLYNGESFLSENHRLPAANVLVVEGWIGAEGVRAAKLEFEANGYDLIVTSGGNPDPASDDNWQKEGWTYAEGASRQLIRIGIPPEKVIPAPAQETEAQRTYFSALGVKSTLAKLGLRPKSINVFTCGAHARRSRLVYAKAFGPETEIGVIAWQPPAYGAAPWWKSSERAIELIVQTIGFFYELLFNSGRA
jgi:DUF218 domain